jgi:hypothetical protein
MNSKITVSRRAKFLCTEFGKHFINKYVGLAKCVDLSPISCITKILQNQYVNYYYNILDYGTV